MNTSYCYYLNYKYSKGATKQIIYLCFPKEDTHRKRTRHSDLNFKTGPILKLQIV